MKKHPIMWTVIVLSLSLNAWLLARIPEVKMGGGLGYASADKQFSASFSSLHAANRFHPNRERFGELGVSSREDQFPDVFTMRFIPVSIQDMDFRQDASLKWVDDKHIVEAATPFLSVRLDLDALANYRHRNDND